MTGVMTLRKFPPIVSPNVKSNNPVDGLLTCQLLCCSWPGEAGRDDVVPGGLGPPVPADRGRGPAPRARVWGQLRHPTSHHYRLVYMQTWISGRFRVVVEVVHFFAFYL